ncbi:MAG: hypothetical protein ACYS76_09485 [Planctomycetota bacterium]
MQGLLGGASGLRGREASRYGIVAGACPDCQGKEIHFDRMVRVEL